MIELKDYNVVGKLIYDNPLSSEEDIKDFILEGSAIATFPQARMRLENALSAVEGQKANYVLWCPEDFPSDCFIEWDFWPIADPGLAILFFGAKGRNNEDLFDDSLAPRTGEYPLYHSGDINAFHVSYFRRKEDDERALHTCNLRKSHGFHLVAQGGDPIPNIADAKGPYKISLLKIKNEIRFFVNEVELFCFVDDGETYGPLIEGGKIGFRQLAPLVAEYANLKVYEIEEV